MLKLNNLRVSSFIIRNLKRTVDGHYLFSGDVIYRYEGSLYWKDTNQFYKYFSLHAKNLTDLKIRIVDYL